MHLFIELGDFFSIYLDGKGARNLKKENEVLYKVIEYSNKVTEEFLEQHTKLMANKNKEITKLRKELELANQVIAEKTGALDNLKQEELKRTGGLF